MNRICFLLMGIVLMAAIISCQSIDTPYQEDLLNTPDTDQRFIEQGLEEQNSSNKKEQVKVQESEQTNTTKETSSRFEAISLIQPGEDIKAGLKNYQSAPPDSVPVDMDPKTLNTLRNVYTSPGDLPHLKLKVDGESYDLPLEHTHVKADLTGYVATVEVRQKYKNPFAYPIETTYVFPLPENSAVNGMKFIIGDRVIEAQIKKRQEARQIYEKAKKQGHTTALLEQERPNIFTQSVANIAAGSEIDVIISYVQDLTYDDGSYEFVFPMVVGPRFIPGNNTDENLNNKGTGWAPDTDEVPDASRITPPVVGGGMRTGHDISLELTADAGFPIGQWEVPTHKVAGERLDDGTLDLTLAELKSLPNRDFVLRYKVDTEQPQVAVISHSDTQGGFFTLVLQPPELDIDTLVGRRELIFVVDISGSMMGIPMSMCKTMMSQFLENLRPMDTFNVITFAGGNSKLFKNSRPANKTNLLQATRFVDGMRSGGGTMMKGAVEEALSPPIEADRHRYVIFMTDGFVGNEDGIMKSTGKFIKEHNKNGRKARVFGIGVGSSINHNLIKSFEKHGKGLSLFVTKREDPTKAVQRMQSVIDHPVMTDISVDWGKLSVKSVFPKKLPDMFASRPLFIHGRYNELESDTITVRGTLNGSPIEMPLEVSFKEKASNDKVLPLLWARAKITELEEEKLFGDKEKAIEDITQIGLDFKLVTAFTSFVAVDSSTVVSDGDPLKIIQPVDAPEGMDMGGIPQQAFAPTGGSFGLSGTGISGGGSGMGGGGSSYGGIGIGGTGTRGRGHGKVTTKERKERKIKSHVKTGKPKVSGSLDKTVIQRVMRQKRQAIRYCYEKSLKIDPTMSGKIVVSFVITPEGTVSEASIKSNTLKNEDIKACLLKVIRSMKFPAPKGGGIVKITYPFVFSPE